MNHKGPLYDDGSGRLSRSRPITMRRQPEARKSPNSNPDSITFKLDAESIARITQVIKLMLKDK
jgi:hypothetical protein